MKPERFKKFYSHAKTAVRIGLRLYHRKVQFHGYEEYVPDDVAFFHAANHQNTFLDPILIAAFTKKTHQHNYVVRADVFNKSTEWIFSLIRMYPIYRQRDSGSKSREKNERMFKIYADLLKNEESIIIFVEGNHSRKRRLRPIRKGIARMAHVALEEADYDLPMKIVPTGIHYHDHDGFYSDTLIVYGPPLDLAPYHDDFREQPAKAYSRISKDLFEPMQKVMIDIRSEEYHDTIDRLRAWLSPDLTREQGSDPEDLYQLFLREREIIAAMDQLEADDEEKLKMISSEVATYEQALAKAKIKDESVARGADSMGLILRDLFGLVLTLPVFLYGYLNHAIFLQLANRIPPKIAKDYIFHAALRFGAGLLILPIFYLIQAGIVAAFTNWIWAATYLITLIPMGRFATLWHHQFRRWQSRNRLARLVRSGKDTLSGMRRSIKEKVWKQIKAVQESVSSEAV